jgi:TonB family protein
MSQRGPELTALDPVHWSEELEDEQRRRLRRGLVVSGVVHLLCVALLFVAPEPEPFAMPQAITVDLVAAVPAPAKPAAPAKPKPVVAVPPAPPPPPPKPKVKLLPKEAPTPTPQPKAEPKPKPEPTPRPEPKPEVRRPERPKELSYDDALAQLRSEVGEESPVVPAPEPVAKAETSAPAGATSSRGMPVAPEVAAWSLAVMRHIRANWIMPSEFRDSGLAAMLEIDVAEDGRVLGQPELVRSSGNPYFDDNAIRAVVKASPLPHPPKTGRRTLIFTSED